MRRSMVILEKEVVSYKDEAAIPRRISSQLLKKMYQSLWRNRKNVNIYVNMLKMEL